MNNCIIMAEVVQDPQLRYTPDNQTPVTEMWVQFAGLREEDPPSKLKVVGWGNLAQEIQERYHVGDRVIVEGRLNISTVDRSEGFKEKRAELTAQRLHLLGADASLTSTTPLATSQATTSSAAAPSTAKPAKSTSARPSAMEAAKTPAYTPAPDPVDYDEIPF